MTEKPFILVPNDDGIHAKGLRELVEVMHFFGDVVVISSEVSMSGKSCAITVDQPLRATEIEKILGVPTYKSTGTPVDSVKLSFNSLFERTPDFVVSGINHGANSGISVIYSGPWALPSREVCMAFLPLVSRSTITARTPIFRKPKLWWPKFSECDGERVAAIYLPEREYSAGKTQGN
jgi:5'-nucleotidase